MALTCLLDTSVWNRLDRAPTLAAEVTTRLRDGKVGYTDIERLEVLRSARHIDHYRRLNVCSPHFPRLPSPKRRYGALGKCSYSSSSEGTTEA